jgi:tRNA threonylcarbamoyladenosine biosynthesis protein TsaB
VAGASSLQVLAHNLGGTGLVCPVLNARREQVYTALYGTGRTKIPELVLPELAMPISSLVDALSQYNEPIWFCGDGVDLVMPIAQERLADPRQMPLHQMVNRAATLADLAQYLDSMDVDRLTPIYLRESQAEVQLRLKQEAQNGC